MADRYDLVIIGLGSAGLAAAAMTGRLGLRVAAVDPAPPGGDCLWTGCVPSKALIAAGRAAHAARTAARFGIDVSAPVVDGPAVLDRIRSVQGAIAGGEDSPEHLASIGVDLIVGRGQVTGRHEVTVGDRVLRTRFILVATGAQPSMPSIDGIEHIGARTTEDLWAIDDLPARLVIVGGGPIALELSQALARLGVHVTVLELADQVLAREEPALVGDLVATLRAEGVTIETGAVIEAAASDGDVRVLRGTVGGEARTWEADEVLVATGRRPNVAGLGLGALGIAADGPLEVDGRLRTAVPSIYAAGDCTTRPPFTHVAGYDAVQAVRDMFLPGRGRVDDLPLWVTFTEPELAHVGLTAVEARAVHGDRARVHEIDLATTDRGRTDGLVRSSLIVVTVRGRIVGAHVLAPGGGELIAELALAIRTKVSLTRLGSMVHAYPTLSMAVGMLAAREGERLLEDHRRGVAIYLRIWRALGRR